MCNICKTKRLKDIKGNDFKGNIKRFCLDCQKKHKEYINKLIDIETQNTYLKAFKDNSKQIQQIKENKLIPFNYWIIEDRQKEKKFLKQQNNKDFLKEQFKKDLNELLKVS